MEGREDEKSLEGEGKGILTLEVVKRANLALSPGSICYLNLELR